MLYFLTLAATSHDLFVSKGVLRISLLGWLCFVVCRTVHGFLFVEVEQRKADLGGVFWVTSLEQVQQGAGHDVGHLAAKNSMNYKYLWSF